MLDFQQKRKIRSVTYNRITLVILFLLVLIVARSTWVVYQKHRISEDMKNVSLQDVEKLRQRSNELKLKMEKLETNTGIEEEIRLKFNVVKERENMVVIVEDENKEASTTSPKVSIWNKIVNFFRN
ncbi:MAG: hypothetical protein WCW47_02400 [Candidatus Paceibacterota bacterium]|jgi:cell division protein FtsB